ncbi:MULTISPECIES: M3 family metallopeptidase [Sphingomonas]|uniref:M3 family metallopeptidase n=1 Tax=Sphingomonas TaxID=13687 RepID=UPI00234EB25D|nr:MULTISPECIES: M3 family metallopeptidase [Sphingomonas]WCP71801.1 M3 family metallopeptidase [Sphingomonas hankookensis]
MSALPDFAAITPDTIAPTLDALLAERDAAADAAKAANPSFAATWLPVEQADVALDNFWSSVWHLHAVADTPELRAAHAAGQAVLTERGIAAQQDRAMFDTLRSLAVTPDFAQLDDADRVAVERSIRDRTLAGVALDDTARERFKEVATELSALQTAFASAVLDATDAWTLHVTDEARLAGLSEADRAMMAAAAEARGLTGWVVTLQQPSVVAVLTFAEDRSLRAEVYRAYGTRASDQGPDAGKFDNGPRIRRILELRHEAARLLGFPDPVARSLSTKMAPDVGEVLAFLRDLAQRARPHAEAEIAELRAFAAEHLGIDDLQPWDIGFVGDRLKRHAHAIDQSVVNQYFPVDRVLAGWRALLGQLFGLTLTERPDVTTYHPDARYYDVADEDGVFAGLYLDLHARPGKKGGAWMAPARPYLTDASLPVAYMVCNFAPTGGATPLLSHDDVTTLLHETGHCLHHLFTRVPRPDIAGTTGFEWDAVELPSQLMEDFAWEPSVLAAMSGHVETGEPLPRDLFERMLAARRFQSGMFLVRQIEFAMFDLLLHLGTQGDDPMAVIEAVRDEVAVVRPPAWHRFPNSFAHIFAGGYAAGYYSYLWAELLAADGFAAFVEAGTVDRATGDRLRETVLSQGAVRPAIELFRAFRGRDPDPAAMLARHGLV